MDKLSLNIIGIYVEQLEQGGLRIPFSTFFLAVIKHFRVHVSQQGQWFSFEIKTGGCSKKCFKEVTSSLKGWKKKFFLIDRRAILDAMPLRYIHTDVHDDFPVNYNENDNGSKGELIPDDKHHLVCTITPLAIGGYFRRRAPIQRSVEKPNAIIAAAREKKKRQGIAKIRAKRVGEGSSAAP
nr:hypothetical protein [Tanacetum cinerariifolium]